jgi:Ca-activated chloride channel family protein
VFNHTRAVLARAEITVVPVSASVTPPAEVAAGAEFEVPWEGPNSKGDFITIVPAGTREKQYGGYAYTRDGSPAKLRAPEKAGAYEIRYLSGQGYATLASSPITVR